MSEVIADTVKFILRYIPIPEVYLDDHIKTTANDLIHLLLHKSPVIPALQLKSSCQALIQLAQILQRDSLPTIILEPLPILQQLPPIPTTDIISL